MAATIIFVHIPKTAGRTLEAVLDRQYPQKLTYSIYGYGGSIEDNVNTLRDMPDAEKQKLKFVKGHYQFGLHHLLSQNSTYLTFLRNPIKRVISHYNYVSRDSKHPFYKLIHEQGMGLKEYVEQGLSVELNNGQTRLLSGKEHGYEFGNTPEELLTLSIENIENHFSLVGLVERFDESLLLMKKILGYEDIRYVSQNISKNSNRKAEIPAETLAAIEYYNSLDIKLYNYAQEKFQQLVENNQAFLDQALIEFHQENQNYQWWGNLNRIAQAASRKITSGLR